MRKRIVFIMATACVFLITGCGASNSVEDLAGADSQMTGNTEQTDTEENVVSENFDDATFMNETQEPTGEEDWDDKAFMESGRQVCQPYVTKFNNDIDPEVQNNEFGNNTITLWGRVGI